MLIDGSVIISPQCYIAPYSSISAPDIWHHSIMCLYSATEIVARFGSYLLPSPQYLIIVTDQYYTNPHQFSNTLVINLLFVILLFNIVWEIGTKRMCFHTEARKSQEINSFSFALFSFLLILPSLPCHLCIGVESAWR